MSAIDWDAVKVGDPDPTFPPDPADGGCDAATSEPDPWWCTRDTGHDPPHVAGTSEIVAAVWR